MYIQSSFVGRFTTISENHSIHFCDNDNKKYKFSQQLVFKKRLDCCSSTTWLKVPSLSSFDDIGKPADNCAPLLWSRVRIPSTSMVSLIERTGQINASFVIKWRKELK